MGILGMLAKGVIGYANSASNVEKAASVLALAEAQDGWVSSEDFLDAYDVRSYNMENNRYDIKIMKNHDFEGGYVLWNKTRNCYHTGVGSGVYKKVERHFRGYGNQAVFRDSENGDEFAVSLLRLSRTEFDNVQALESALRSEYGEYPDKPASCDKPKEGNRGSGLFGFRARVFK